MEQVKVLFGEIHRSIVETRAEGARTMPLTELLKCSDSQDDVPFLFISWILQSNERENFFSK
jgi:hypothetical protein